MLEIADVHLNADCTEGFEHTFVAGEIAVILGSNQSGKTDLCRLIAGLHTQAHGEVRLDGEDLQGLKPQNRPVSMVYQAFVNYPNLTVHENIASPIRAQKVPTGERNSRVAELAGQLQLSELLDRMPHELSGGQQQRLAIARALAKSARVLLLDEPLVNLDFKLREILEYELRDLLRATNTIVIYTSSDPRDAFSLGDQLLLLADGRKVQAGPPIVAAGVRVLDLIEAEPERVARSHAATDRFRTAMVEAGFSITPGIHPIVPIMLGDERKTMQMADAMNARGIFVVGFSYPVVPKGQARIRVQISAAHTQSQLARAVEAFVKVGKKHGVVS